MGCVVIDEAGFTELHGLIGPHLPSGMVTDLRVSEPMT